MDRTRPLLLPIALAALLLAGWALRMHTAPEALAEPRVRLYEADPYLHLRRAVRLTEGAPDLGYTDPFQNFPDAQVCSQLPVGFAGLMALAGSVTPGPDPAERIALGGGVVAVPLLGVLAAWLAWRLGRKRSILFGFSLATGVALLPIAVDASMAGRMDHHVLDPLVVAAMLLALTDVARPWRAGLAAGVVGAAALASFPSALVTVTVTLAAAPVAGLLAATAGGTARPFARVGAIAGLTAGLLGLGFHALLTPCVGSTALLANTWLPPALALVVAAVAAVVWLTLPREGLQRRACLLIAAGVVVPVLILAAVPTARAWLDVLQGRFAGRLTNEWAALWQTTPGWWSGKLTWAFLLIPMGWLWLLRQARRADAQPTTQLLAAHVWLVAPAFAIQAKYFSHLAVIALCAGLAALLELVALWRRAAPVRTRRLAAALGLVLVPLLAIEPVLNYRAKTLVWTSTQAVTEVLAWLDTHARTVKPARPAWGVLSLWSNGFWIAALGQRPTYTNNFVAAPESSAYVQHILDSFEWLYSADGALLQDAMVRKRLRYLLTTPSDAHELRAFQATTPRPIAGLLTGPAEDANSQPGEAFARSNLVHLVAFQGTRQPGSPCLDGLQLQAGSQLTLDVAGRRVPAVQLYERVAGAHVRAEALAPGTRVRVGTGRRLGATAFTFECEAVADTAGRADVRWPYPSEPTGQVQPTSPVLVWLGEDATPVALTVSAAAVVHGVTVPVAR